MNNKMHQNPGIVNTHSKYCYDTMIKDLESLKNKYTFIKIYTIGYSVLGRPIPAVKLGTGKEIISYNGSHHGIEWITTPLVMKFIEEYAKHYTKNTKFQGHDMNPIYEKKTIWMVPMVNPDGVELAIKGLTPDLLSWNNTINHTKQCSRNVPVITKEQLILWNRGNTDFSKTWKANIRGVDLNHNYDAGWHISKSMEKSMGVEGPAPTRYSGPCPESEPESKALADFTRRHGFSLVLAFHSQGREIYWNYKNIASDEAKGIAGMLAKVSGYKAVGNITGPASHAGYKDWFIEKFNKPGFTIEVGNGINPLPLPQFPSIWEGVKKIMLLCAAL